MVLIGIDGGDANTFPRVGSGRYGYEIIRHLLPFPEAYHIYLDRPPLPDMPKAKNVTYRHIWPSMLWTQFGLPLDLLRNRLRPDVFFTPTHYAPRYCPVPLVITIFDLSFLKKEFELFFRLRDLWQLRSWTAYSVKNAAHILTISEHSKQDIVSVYGVPSPKVTVTYLGPDPVFSQSTVHPGDVNALPERYVLFVGTIQPRKNLERLIDAFSMVATEGMHLVIAGRKGWLYEAIFAKARESAASERIRFLGYVPEEELPSLFANASVFVLPSLYEGFGIPVLNAFAARVPVVASNVSSLPEIVGDAGVLVDPYSVSAIADGIEKALREADNLRKKGSERVKLFSWERCASQTLAILRGVARG